METTKTDQAFAVLTKREDADAPPVTEKELAGILNEAYEADIDEADESGRARFRRSLSRLDRSIRDCLSIDTPVSGFLYTEDTVAFRAQRFAIKGESRLSLIDLHRVCSKSEHPMNLLGELTKMVLAYREDCGIPFESKDALIEVGKDGMKFTYIPRAADGLITALYDSVNKVEVYKDDEEGLALAELIDTTIRPISPPPKSRGKSKGEWKGLTIAQNVEGVGAEVRLRDQMLVLRNPLDCIQQIVQQDKFDARVNALADAERLGWLSMALPQRVMMSGQQVLLYLGEQSDTNAYRWTKANIKRVNTAFWSMRMAAVIADKNGALLPVFYSDVRRDPLTAETLYTFGRAGWLNDIRQRRSVGGPAAAMRVTGGLFWRVAGRGSLSPLAMRFLSTAERVIYNSDPIPDGNGRLIPTLLHPNNRDWIEVGFDDWCNKLARIDYDPNIRPTGNNTVQAKLKRALAVVVDYTRNHPTTVDFDFGSGHSDRKRGSGIRLRFRASAAFRSFHAKRTKHENMLTQIPIQELVKRLKDEG